MKKRLLCLSISFTLLLAVFVGRLGVIQIIEGSKYRVLAEKQCNIVLSGLSTRGTVKDRSNRPLTDMKESFVFLIEEERLDDQARNLLAEVEAVRVNSGGGTYQIYRSSMLDRTIFMKLSRNYRAHIIKSGQRYCEDQPAVHMIGYVNQLDQFGVCGIEKDFDKVLSSGEKVFSVMVDGQGHLIPGAGIRVDGGGREWSVLTTLDLDIQQACEQILGASGRNGAIVVTHIPSGEILASASTPVYDPNQIHLLMSSDGDALLNKATSCEYPPGSVFKIIVTAAALEKGVVTPDTVFACAGYHDLEGTQIQCSTGGFGGHGEITMKEAFAQSCNAVMIQAGQLAGAREILNTAKAFGLSEEAIDLLSGQAAGNLPDLDEALGAGIGNLSIGQGSLLVTPMQVARITQIIAADGLDKGLSVIRGTVEGIRGAVMAPKKQEKQVISRETAKKIREMMELTVTTGTAKSLVLPAGIAAAGKTGSAEIITAEGPGVHSWFTGYVPASDPLYGITVFVENGGSGAKTALPVFEELVLRLFL